MAFTSVTALLGGAEMTGALVLSAVTEIGVATSLVGMVTGNADLMKIGGVMGLVGGVGGLINGATGAVTSAADAAAAPGVDIAGYPTQAGMDAAASSAGQGIAEAASNAANTGLISEYAADADLAGGLIPNETLQASQITGQAAPTLTQSVAPTTADATAVTGQADGLSPAGAQAAKAPVGAKAPVDTVTPGAVGPQASAQPLDGSMDQYQGAVGPKAAAQPLGASFDPYLKPQSYFDKFLNFVKNNKEVANGALMLGGGMLKGMNDKSISDDKLALERQRLAQTGFGNQVANYKTPGIVQSARGFA